MICTKWLMTWFVDTKINLYEKLSNLSRFRFPLALYSYLMMMKKFQLGDFNLLNDVVISYIDADDIILNALIVIIFRGFF